MFERLTAYETGLFLSRIQRPDATLSAIAEGLIVRLIPNTR